VKLDLPSQQEIEAACRDMPLFPLPDISLFPFTILRLHVFEPRYVQLLRDVLSSTKLMAIPSLSDGWEKQSEKPSIESIAGIGYVAQMQELPDDRYLILLIGVGRLLITGEHEQKEMYRRGYGQFLLERDDVRENFQQMKELFIQLLMKKPALSKEIQPLLEEGIKPMHMCNAVGHLLLRQPAIRQEFLCANTLEERCTLIIAEITEILLHNNFGYDA
jgi:uncharacterized protein